MIVYCRWIEIVLCILKINDLWSLAYSLGVWNDPARSADLSPNPNVLLTLRLLNIEKKESPIAGLSVLRPRLLLIYFLFTNLFAFVLVVF